MRATRARRTLVLMAAAGLVALPVPGPTGPAAGALPPGAVPTARPEPVPPADLRGTEPAPIPLVEPRGPGPVPVPLVEPREPLPVPMPQLDGGLRVDVEQLTPRRPRPPEPVSRRRR